MSNEKLVLVVDTNLFLECRPLETLPWSELHGKEIELVVTRPVQNELDQQKKNRNGRTFKKALQAFTMLRDLVISSNEFVVLQNADPRVSLSLMAGLRAQRERAPELDPATPDDAILLRMMDLISQQPGADIRLLTHDTGPMATAKTLGLQFVPIPESWLLDPQDDADARAAKKYKAEVDRLRRQEPVLQWHCSDQTGDGIARLKAAPVGYQPLGSQDVDNLIERLTQRFPLVTDFTPDEPAPVSNAASGRPRISVTEYIPPTEAQIRTYSEESYPDWLDSCRDYLETLHQKLYMKEDRPKVFFDLSNSGTRPASAALITFSALGEFYLFAPRSKDDDEVHPQNTPIRLPSPPRAPRGEWRGSSLASRSMDPARWPRSDDMVSAVLGRDRLDAIRLPHVPEHDSDAFYWKGGRSYTPKQSLSLTCDNWRHGIQAKTFCLELVMAQDADRVEGAVRCQIHAENLSDPLDVKVPIELTRDSRPSLNAALGLIDTLK